MGDHLWPALYPGLIIGAVIGLMLRGTGNVITAILGGLAGAWLSTWVVATAGLDDGLPSLIALVLLSALGAFGVAGAYRYVSGSGRS
ncbi:hypothetical protein DLM45_06710 [Hyphomicrobium methylovorum]|uniref:hypothetical protein n=1 Tax=Hyphomicrobium methylovorum TaxID=84 RepID=UPI0015E76840|nr:hypothetical protein [Hyphomicrobium methylovorum]MBA2125914.1 hypothetical protein [Hyphomicrobium methylovorum]